MIVFKMKILNYNPSGSYSVEYIPENKKCTTMKLDILINPSIITDKDQVLNLLRNSSPQDYWVRELGNTDVDLTLLTSLVNTTHSVNEITTSVVNNPVSGFSTPSYTAPQQQYTPPDDQPVVENSRRANLPNSTPEEVTSVDHQARLKLKLIIQEVLMEMAEATV